MNGLEFEMMVNNFNCLLQSEILAHGSRFSTPTQKLKFQPLDFVHERNM